MQQYDAWSWHGNMLVFWANATSNKVKWSWFEPKVQIQTPYVIIQMPFTSFVLNSSDKLF